MSFFNFGQDDAKKALFDPQPRYAPYGELICVSMIVFCWFAGKLLYYWYWLIMDALL